MGEEVYERLAEKIFAMGSKIIPQLFKMIADEEEAGIMLALPGTAEDIAGKFGKSVEEARQILENLFWKGLVFKSRKPEGLIYRMCNSLVQFHDATLVWPDAPQEYLDLWQRYMEEEWPSYAEAVARMLPKPFSRVIPVMQPVEMRSRILAYEDIEKIIETVHPIAVTRCTCRTIERKCNNPIEVCLQVGRAADYTIERGSGREISKEEAMEIIRQCEEAGLVHVTMNRAEDSHFICNCCDDCCMSFKLALSEGLTLCDPSRFLCVIDKDLCNGCAICIDRCHFQALSVRDEDGGEIAVVDANKCMGCGLCMIKCPENAISMQEIREADFIPR
jgi:ferredoxin